ncbi:DsrE family protein [Siphonobacter aquaeclarae]|jgi:intracellular sulfur oxidation DsrE/DsrF family protein|uniref:Uncharacterized protein n=1 Tax=Siphonobacter aquaeclarae TaxID=563176 RepID=A0A1G9I3D4_9BACT|nr:DsrE family protein [Siphonobacter aquaeclarae]SDL19748.1 hypothetical protein SAMN04488090_0320 [Siphonobacter aquaeclarae]
MKALPVLAFVFLLSSPVFAQVKKQDPAAFHGALADAKVYKVVYQLNSSDDKVITATLRNIKNALADPRLKNKLEVELVAHGGGVELFRKTNPYETQLRELQDSGVILAECENTMRERKIGKEELFDFISYVPSGNGEIIIRQQQGWGIIHP